MLMRPYFSPGECWRFCGQIEHLKEGPIKNDQIFFYEGVSGPDVIVHRKLEQGADGIVGVEGQTLAVRDQDEEKVQQQLFLIEGRKKALREKAVGDKAETAFDPPYTLRPEHCLFDHGPQPPFCLFLYGRH
jgi:hypothetical protein